MKIYTRAGDDGNTSLFAGGKISKTAPRIHAYGTVDELNAVIGVGIASDVPDELKPALEQVQNDLFTIGADLATPMDAHPKWLVRTSDEFITRLECEIDSWQSSLPELRNFILPGGTPAAAALHQARVVCRRAERWGFALAEIEDVNPQALIYLNRLSDWLFVAARMANFLVKQDEMTWNSPKNTR